MLELTVHNKMAWHEDRKPRLAQTKKHYGSIPAYSNQQRKFFILKYFSSKIIIVQNAKHFTEDS